MNHLWFYVTCGPRFIGRFTSRHEAVVALRELASATLTVQWLDGTPIAEEEYAWGRLLVTVA